MSAVYRTLTAGLLAITTLIAVAHARRSSDGSPWLLVVLFGIATLVAIAGACGAAWTEASAAAYERRQGRRRGCRCGHQETGADQ